MKTKIAASGSLENLTTLINEYYYSTNYIITPENTVFNTKTFKTVGTIEFKKGRYYFFTS